MPLFFNRRTVLLGLAASALPGRALGQTQAERIPIELYEEALELEGAIRVGAPRGDITMVEFFDYNCPFCRRSAADLPALLKGDPDLSYVLVNYAVLGAPSVEATRVALGFYDLYGPRRALDFHARLSALRGIIGGQRALDAARELGADVNRLAAAADAGKITGWMKENLRVGSSLGLAATPSFLVGPEAFVGGLDLQQKRAWISRARA